MANIVVLIRSLLIFLVIYLLNNPSVVARIAGLIVLVLVALMDWLDGYLARRLKIDSKLGGLLDTLGDRITENLLFIFFAYKYLIPLFVPLIFVARSFMADFIRAQCYANGIGTFSINKSKLGVFFVSSRPSRVLYLFSKISIFFLGGAVLIVESIMAGYQWDLYRLLMVLKQVVYYGAVFVLIFNIIRFLLLIYDSRSILKDTFIK